MNELALFAGAGGGILGGKLLGWTTVCAVEWEPYPTSVLIARQNEGILPAFPIWDDVRTFDGTAWRGRVDVVSGGFPCQDISSAGKGAGIDGERSGMWSHMARIIREVGPRFVFVENSPMLTSRGLGRVLGDLAAMGYDAQWGVLGAIDAGAPHRRDRIWIVAHADNGRSIQDFSATELRAARFEQSPQNQGGAPETKDEQGPKRIRWWDADPADLADAVCERGSGLRIEMDGFGEIGQGGQDSTPDGNAGDAGDATSTTQPRLGRVANGVAARVDRLKAIGNGQVPAVAALAWRILSGK